LRLRNRMRIWRLRSRIAIRSIISVSRSYRSPFSNVMSLLPRPIIPFLSILSNSFSFIITGVTVAPRG
jgi:hypothetical protein